MVNYLLSTGYTETEAKDLINDLTPEDVKKVSKEIKDTKNGGMNVYEEAILLGVVLNVLAIISIIYIVDALMD